MSTMRIVSAPPVSLAWQTGAACAAGSADLSLGPDVADTRYEAGVGRALRLRNLST